MLHLIIMPCKRTSPYSKFTEDIKDTSTVRLKLMWSKCVGNSTYHSGHPVGSTALAAASAPAGSWGSEMGERHQGVCSGAPGTRLVWADLSVQ